MFTQKLINTPLNIDYFIIKQNIIKRADIGSKEAIISNLVELLNKT